MPVMTRNDLKINYQTLGPDMGPGSVPVALIHGLGANLAFWYLGASRHMGSDRPVLMHDLRGHGASSMPQSGYLLGQLAEDLGQLLTELGQQRAHIVGHSHGARVALAFALQHPERVASLTIADTQLQALQPMMRLADWAHWPAWKAELARQVGTSQSYIGRLETGGIDPQLSTVRKIALALGVPVAELVESLSPSELEIKV